MTDLTPRNLGLSADDFGMDGDRPYVFAAPFAAVLDYTRTSDALKHLDDGESGTAIRRTRSANGVRQTREMTIIYETGMWRLIFRSNKPEARALTGRVTEILAEIRRTGGYISPTATADQLDAIARRAESQARVLATLRGVVDKSWLDAKGRHVAARALGEEPEVDAATRPLTVGEYLEDKGVTGEALRSLSTRFGKYLKAAYRDRYDREPATVDRFVGGALRKVAGYTEKHRPLFDRVWRELAEDAA